MGEQRKVEPYKLAVAFERIVATLMCSSRTFWQRVGSKVDPDAMEDEAARIAAKAAHAIARESGHYGVSTVIALQRVQRQMTDGRATFEHVSAVAQMFDDVEDAGLPPEDVVISELAPILRRRAKKDAVKRAVDAYGVQDDEAWDKAVVEAGAATKIGDAEDSRGISLARDVEGALMRRKGLTCLPTGVPELDAFLDGGIERQRLGIYMADTGAGKSTWLNHVSANTLLLGRDVAFATLELPEDEELARLAGNLTGMEWKSLLNGHMQDGLAKLRTMYATLGDFRVRWFTPGVTTVADIRAWVAEVERENGRPVDLVCVDPLDELIFTGAGARDSTYTVQGKATKELRNWIKESGKYCWATSHVKAGDSRRKVITTNDVQDSRGKVKTPDVVLSAMLGENGTEITFNIAKNRGGKGHTLVGPFPTGFAYGMIVNVARGASVEKESAF